MEGAVLLGEWTKPATGRTRLELGQGLGLALQQRLQGCLDQSGGGGLGDLLRSVEIKVNGVVAGASGHDLA